MRRKRKTLHIDDFVNSPCAGPRNRPKSGCCSPAEATYKLFSRQWRKKKVTSGSFPLSCGLSWHNATIFVKDLSLRTKTCNKFFSQFLAEIVQR